MHSLSEFELTAHKYSDKVATFYYVRDLNNITNDVNMVSLFVASQNQRQDAADSHL